MATAVMAKWHSRSFMALKLLWLIKILNTTAPFFVVWMLVFVVLGCLRTRPWWLFVLIWKRISAGLKQATRQAMARH